MAFQRFSSVLYISVVFTWTIQYFIFLFLFFSSTIRFTVFTSRIRRFNEGLALTCEALSARRGWCLYIYIYRERERETIYIYLYIYIYIYIYIERERERERERDRERQRETETDRDRQRQTEHCYYCCCCCCCCYSSSSSYYYKPPHTQSSRPTKCITFVSVQSAHIAGVP